MEVDEVNNRDLVEIDEITQCPECGQSNLEKDYKRAEIVCKDCGLVVESESIDSRQEKVFDKETLEKRRHTGPPINHNGLSTTIGWENQDFHGGKIPRKNFSQLKRIRKWNERMNTIDTESKKLINLITEISRLSYGMRLPRNIREKASLFCKQASEKNLIRGKIIESIAGACVYGACRELKIPKTLSEIAEISGKSETEIGRTFRFLSRYLGIKSLKKFTSPEEYVPGFCNELRFDSVTTANISNETIKIILQRKDELEGKSPPAIAGALLYMTIIKRGEYRTQKEVADVAEITEMTIRNIYKPIAEKMNISHLFNK